MHSATAHDYTDLEIRIDPLRGNSYPVTLVVDGARQYSGRMDKSILPWLASYSPEQDGEALLSYLFADPDLRSAWGEARSRVRRRIRLAISQDAPELHAIPWELLREHIAPYPPVTLAAAGDTPFSRYLYGGWEPGQPVQARPVRMLVAVANPDGIAKLGLTAIDVEREWRLIHEATDRPGLQVELLPQPCTLSALADKLADGFHILHLVCHGSFADELGIAALYLADGTNQVVRVHDDEIVAALRNRLPAVPEKDRLRLIFLASCETATRSPADAFRGLAPKLVAAGVPVVLAMQDKVPVRTAQVFSGTFYEKLLQHGLVDLASNQARAHIIAERLPGPSVPVLFMRLPDGRLLELPQGDRRLNIDQRRPFEPDTVLIPDGPFLMGADDPAVLPWEQPEHSVSLSDFRIGKYPVTNRQYAAFIKDNKDQAAPQSWFNREPSPIHLDHPVTSVSWYDAMAYCAWLSQQTGRRYTLPSEAEWEKAAGSEGVDREAGRLGGDERRQRYPWGSEWIEGRCNAAGTGTTAVTAHPDGASSYGVEDLLGNVQQWTRSLWGSQPASPGFGYPYDPDDGREIVDPKKLPAAARVVHRGGSFKSVPADLRCSARGNALPDSKIDWRGFRVGMEV